MSDLIYVAIAVAFFALTWVLVAFASRLEQGQKGGGTP